MTAHRYPTAETAQIEVYGRLGRIVGQMKNLSITGAFIEIDPGYKVPLQGDLIRATVYLKTLRKTHVVDAEVVWSKDAGIGINFLKKHELLEKMFEKNQVRQEKPGSTS